MMLIRALIAPFRKWGFLYVGLVSLIPVLGGLIASGITIDYIGRVWRGEEDPPPLSLLRQIQFGFGTTVILLLVIVPGLCIEFLPMLMIANAIEDGQGLGLFEIILIGFVGILVLIQSVIISAMIVAYGESQSLKAALAPSRWIEIIGTSGFFGRWFAANLIALILFIPIAALYIFQVQASESIDESSALAVIASSCALLCASPLYSGYISLFLGHYWGSLGGALE